MYNVMEIGELKAQLAKEKQATENYEAMLSRMVEERNAAIAREEEARSPMSIAGRSFHYYLWRIQPARPDH